MDGCEAKVHRLNPVNIETFTVQREPVLLHPPPPHGVHVLYCTPSVLYLCVHHCLGVYKGPFYPMLCLLLLRRSTHKVSTNRCIVISSTPPGGIWLVVSTTNRRGGGAEPGGGVLQPAIFQLEVL